MNPGHAGRRTRLLFRDAPSPGIRSRHIHILARWVQPGEVRPHPAVSLCAFAGVFLLLWSARGEAVNDPWGYVLFTLLLLGVTALGASGKG